MNSHLFPKSQQSVEKINMHDARQLAKNLLGKNLIARIADEIEV